MACVLALAALGGALLGGCGGGTQTVSVSSAPLPNSAPNSAETSTGRHHTASTTTPAASAQTTPAGGAPANTSTATPASGQPTSTTRTAPAPAFVHTGGQSSEQGSSGATTAIAAAVVTAHGYTPDVSTYRPNQTLRVMIGTRTGSADGHSQRAFFFLDNRYIGTDSGQPSASLRVVSQSDTEVALAYALYRPHDPLCCPSGGQTTVRFQLDNGGLVPLDPIPPARSATGLSRQ
jgi:hypothetical protein